MDGFKASVKRLVTMISENEGHVPWFRFGKASQAQDHPLFPLGKSIYIFFKKLEDVGTTRVHEKFEGPLLLQIEAKFKPFIANIEFIDSEKRLKRV
jgi:hypothetical protein